MLLLGAAATALWVPFGSPAAAADGTTVFVAGASGSTGRRVVRELRRKGLKVRAGVRDVEKARADGLALDEGVELVTADVTRPECACRINACSCSRGACTHAAYCCRIAGAQDALKLGRDAQVAGAGHERRAGCDQCHRLQWRRGCKGV